MNLLHCPLYFALHIPSLSQIPPPPQKTPLSNISVAPHTDTNTGTAPLCQHQHPYRIATTRTHSLTPSLTSPHAHAHAPVPSIAAPYHAILIFCYLDPLPSVLTFKFKKHSTVTRIKRTRTSTSPFFGIAVVLTLLSMKEQHVLR
jgi:hypothetical protein